MFVKKRYILKESKATLLEPEVEITCRIIAFWNIGRFSTFRNVNILNSEKFPISIKDLKVKLKRKITFHLPLLSKVHLNWTSRLPIGLQLQGNDLASRLFLFHISPALSGSHNGKRSEKRRNWLIVERYSKTSPDRYEYIVAIVPITWKLFLRTHEYESNCQCSKEHYLISLF